MQFIFVTLLLISSFWSAESNNAGLSLYNALFNRQPAGGCVPLTNDYCPIVNALHGLRSSEGDSVGSSNLFDIIPELITLNDIILISLQQFAMFMEDNPKLKADDYDFLIREMVRLVQLLETEGSSAIFWKDLRPLVERFSFALFPSKSR